MVRQIGARSLSVPKRFLIAKNKSKGRAKHETRPRDNDGKKPVSLSANRTSCPPFNPNDKSKKIERNLEMDSEISKSDLIHEAMAPRIKNKIIRSKLAKWLIQFFAHLIPVRCIAPWLIRALFFFPSPVLGPRSDSKLQACGQRLQRERHKD